VRENHPDQNPGKEEDVRPALLGSNESEKGGKKPDHAVPMWKTG
jgi:hypothetical protein